MGNLLQCFDCLRAPRKDFVMLPHLLQLFMGSVWGLCYEPIVLGKYCLSGGFN